MKLLAISDTHYKTNTAHRVIDKLKTNISAVFHLGDMYDDAKKLEGAFKDIPFYYVAGNVDYYCGPLAHMDNELTVCFNGIKIFLTHGHTYKNKLSYTRLSIKAVEEGARIALCGHTHVPYTGMENGVLIVNPGSISEPRDGTGKPSYAVIDINEDGGFSAGIVRLNRYYE